MKTAGGFAREAIRWYGSRNQNTRDARCAEISND